MKGAEIGTKIGGFTGSIAGGTTAGTVTHSALDSVIEDDAVVMMRVVEQEFATICERYLLIENEVYLCLETLKKRLDKKELKNIFASSNRELYAQSIIMKCVNPVLEKREYIKEFDSEDIFLGMRMLIEDFFYIFCTVIVFRFWEDSGIKERGGLFLGQGASFNFVGVICH